MLKKNKTEKAADRGTTGDCLAGRKVNLANKQQQRDFAEEHVEITEMWNPAGLYWRGSRKAEKESETS